MIRCLLIIILTLCSLEAVSQMPPDADTNPEVINTPPPPPNADTNPEVMNTPPPPPNADTDLNESSVIRTDEPKSPEEFLLEQGEFSKALGMGKDILVSEYTLRSDNKARDPFNAVNLQRSMASIDNSTIMEFLDPKMPLESFPIDKLKLTGVLWRTANPKASFLDPNGSAHIARKNERIGINKGYIAAIREGEVIIIEPLIGGESSYQTRIIRISSDDDTNLAQGQQVQEQQVQEQQVQGQ